jgi:FkbM family methyltransferase
MMRNYINRLFVALLNVLPPPLAYRLNFRFFEQIYKGDETLVAKSLFGRYQFSCDLQDVVQKNFLLHGANAFYSLILAQRLLSRGDFVFELGANVGTETLSFSSIVGDSGMVIAVEPSVINITKLDAVIAQNSIVNVMSIQAAVDTEPGFCEFQDGTNQNSGIGFLKTKKAQLDQDNVVKVISVDSLLEYGNPKLIFMDIEGHELRALKGATTLLRTIRPFLILEFNTSLLARSGGSGEELLKLLNDYDYTCFDMGIKLSPILDFGSREIDSDLLVVPNEKVGVISSLRLIQYVSRFLPRMFYK